MKNKGFKLPLLAILCAIMFAFVTMTAYGSGPNPPTGRTHLRGPAIVGTVTMTPSEAGNVNSTVSYEFVGRCQGMDVPIGPELCGLATYAGVNEETLRDYFIGCVDLDRIPCAPDNLSVPPMVIKTVISFEEDTENMIKTARIVVLFISF